MENINLDHISTEDLQAALAARQAKENAQQNEHQYQAVRDYDAKVKAAREQAQLARLDLNPQQWAQQMADRGLPVSVASVVGEVLAVLFNRIDALENQKPKPRKTVFV
jgi:transposase